MGARQFYRQKYIAFGKITLMGSWWRSGKVATLLLIVLLAMLAGRYLGGPGLGGNNVFDSIGIFGDKNTRAMKSWLKEQGSVEKASVSSDKGYRYSLEAKATLKKDASPDDVCALLEGAAAKARTGLENPLRYGDDFTIDLTWDYQSGTSMEFDNMLSATLNNLQEEELIKKHCALVDIGAEEVGPEIRDIKVSDHGIWVQRDTVNEVPASLSSRSLQGINTDDTYYHDYYNVHQWYVISETALASEESGDVSDLVKRITQTPQQEQKFVASLEINTLKKPTGGDKPHVKVRLGTDADHKKLTVASAAPVLAEIMGDTRFSYVQLCNWEETDTGVGCVEYQMADGVVDATSGAPHPLAQKIYDTAAALKLPAD